VTERFLSLSRADQLEALGVAATQSGRPVHLLEKDIWVVWAVNALFTSRFGEHLVFKGGTSLSKGYDVIKRFSEDIDITCDVRELLPEFAKEHPIPATRSQADKWSDAIKKRLPTWVRDEVLPILRAYAKANGVDVTITADGDKIYIAYDPLAEGGGYVAPRVTIEFGARSTGEPAETRAISCDAAAHLPDLEFLAASPKMMRPKRTFWEKATAAHAYCASGDVGDRHSRHWHDLVRLDEAGYAKEAFADRALAKDVAEFKSRFYRGRDRAGNQIDYDAAVAGKLQLVPGAEVMKVLEADYKKMADEGILLGEAMPFAALMERCADLEKRANDL
jgi:hypothetical protein